MLYTYKGNEPEVLPDRIRLSNGLTRTDKTTFTDDEIAAAGYAPVQNRPVVNEMNYKVVWETESAQWNTLELTKQEKDFKIQERWNLIRQERDEMLKASDITALREIEINGVVSEELKVYRQALRDITLQESPLNIVWPSLDNTVDAADK